MQTDAFAVTRRRLLLDSQWGCYMSNQAAASGGNEANPQALDAIVKASETYSIVASQDIVDVRGLKLWAKGQPVSAALQQRLMERKLLHPLEACLTVENGVTLAGMGEELKSLLESDGPLPTVLRPWASVLVAQFKQLQLHSVAQLLLTAALATRPATLPHAVAAMALAGAMMASRQRPVSEIRLGMLGGLLHDIGEVYIQPDYLDHPGALDLTGHKHLAVHPRVAQLILSTTTDYPAALCRGIGEHHERVDGSGYPARLSGPRCSELGRVLAVMEVALGILRTSNPAPLARASFALRVVPGEFDPHWIGLICDSARAAKEAVPARAAVATEAAPVQQIDARISEVQKLADMLKEQGRSGNILEVVDAAIFRLGRLRVAWNALGALNADPHDSSDQEVFEYELACHELHQRLKAMQRECLLLAEGLGEAERMRIEPLWRSLIAE